VLHELLKSPGRVVTRQELAATLWPKELYVDAEHGLNTAVRRLREALGDSADEPRYVETLPKLGYRFIGAIEGGAAPAAAPSAAAEPSGLSSEPGIAPASAAKRRSSAVLIAVAVLAVAGLVLFAPTRAPSPESPSGAPATSAGPPLPPNADEVGELIARGRFLRNTGRLAEAKQFFEQAMKLDPKNAKAVGGVALGYLLEREYELSRATAERALELDPKAADALRALGNIALAANDWAGAERYYKRAVESEPGYAKLHNRLARLLLQMGRFDEGREQMLESRRLDPNDPDVQNIWIDYWFRTADYESAVREGERWLTIWHAQEGSVPNATRLWLGYAYIGARRLEDARAQFRAVDPADDLGAALALAYVGQTSEARAILDTHEKAIASRDASTPSDSGSDGAMAMTYVVTGDFDRAFEHIGRQIAAGVYPDWLNAVMFQPLRQDPRWPALAARLEREFSSGKQWPIAAYRLRVLTRPVSPPAAGKSN
jgi:tetratricopeptide (TPR) repeat protein